MNAPPPSRRSKVAGLTLVLALLSSACNATAPEDFSIHGTWSGSIAELALELTMVLVGRGEVGILGIAELSSLATGMVHGEVSGTLDGTDVDLAIELGGAVVAGSLVFAGTVQGTDAISGTLSSGLLGGSWPIEFRREEV